MSAGTIGGPSSGSSWVRKQAMAQAKADERPAGPPPEGKRDGKPGSWNKLASQLDKSLLQSRDHNPPEQYRNAIENYFKVLSEKAAPAPEPQKP